MGGRFWDVAGGVGHGAGASGALMLYNAAAMALTPAQWKALRLLQAAEEGSTVPALLRRGCAVDELHRLMRDGFTSAEPMPVQGRQPSPSDFYLRITDAGRVALARENRRKWTVRIALLFLLGLFAGVGIAAFLISQR
jgi:hypothetical protein